MHVRQAQADQNVFIHFKVIILKNTPEKQTEPIQGHERDMETVRLLLESETNLAAGL